MRIVIFLVVFTILSAFFFSSGGKISNPTPTKSKLRPPLKEDPCFLYENTNRTQLVYMKLINALRYLSAKKQRTLGDDCLEKIYIPGTWSNQLQREIDEITQMVLDKLNQRTGFMFRKVYNDTITVLEDKAGNRNFIYNTFIQDVHEELNLRLYFNVIKYVIRCPPKSGCPPTCASLTNPTMKFEIGYPQPEQLQPLPTQLITTAWADKIGNKGINRLTDDPISSVYINQVKIFNTNAVINVDSGECVQPATCGNLDKTKLESSEFNQPTTPWQDPACITNQWIRLESEPCGLKNYPCGPPTFLYWNDQGIPTTDCNNWYTGTRSSTTQEPLQAQFNKSIIEIPRNSGPNAWMFSAVRQDPLSSGLSAYTN